MEKIMKKSYVPCNLCGSSESKFLFDAKDRAHGIKGSFTYVQCKDCGLVYMNPQISLEDVKAFYPADYSPHKSHLGKTAKPIKTLKARLIRSYLPKSLLQKLNGNSCVLDVGCGSGKFLGEIKNIFGCKVYGVDISEEATKTAKNDYSVEVFTGVVTAAPFPPDYFDVITAWQYLEHVHNPMESLQMFYRLLKPDGLCAISTPNFDSFNAKIFKDRWFGLECPRHLCIYTPETIDKLLQKTGFSVTGINYDKSSKNLINSLQYYFYENNYSVEHRDKVKKSLMIKAVLSPLSRIFALLKRSDNMIVLAKKVS
jgi:ubiquinone/menaquinone biosynthesis C-methylase UbiE